MHLCCRGSCSVSGVILQGRLAGQHGSACLVAVAFAFNHACAGVLSIKRVGAARAALLMAICAVRDLVIAVLLRVSVHFHFHGHDAAEAPVLLLEMPSQHLCSPEQLQPVPLCLHTRMRIVVHPEGGIIVQCMWSMFVQAAGEGRV